jgi:RHS repeat-associated protein
MANVLSAQDYLPFGMQMPGRSFSGEGYKFGFNGMEKDDEVKCEGNNLNTYWRQYDPKLGRWKSTDPIFNAYESSYIGLGNNPTNGNDPEGDVFNLVSAAVGAGVGADIGAGSEIVKALIKGEDINWKKVGLGATKGLIGSGCVWCADVGAALVEGGGDIYKHINIDKKTSIDWNSEGTKALLGGIMSTTSGFITKGLGPSPDFLTKVTIFFGNGLIKTGVMIKVDLSFSNKFNSNQSNKPVVEIQNSDNIVIDICNDETENHQNEQGQAGAFLNESNAEKGKKQLENNGIKSRIINENGYLKVKISRKDIEKAREAIPEDRAF